MDLEQYPSFPPLTWYLNYLFYSSLRWVFFVCKMRIPWSSSLILMSIKRDFKDKLKWKRIYLSTIFPVFWRFALLHFIPFKKCIHFITLYTIEDLYWYLLLLIKRNMKKIFTCKTKGEKQPQHIYFVANAKKEAMLFWNSKVRNCLRSSESSGSWWRRCWRCYGSPTTSQDLPIWSWCTRKRKRSKCNPRP